MKNFAIVLAVAALAGCAPPLPSQINPNTVASSTPTPSPIEATLAKGTAPPNSESTSLLGWLFPERLKDIAVPTGRTPVGMWMYGSSTDGEAKEFVYNIAWQSKTQKLDGFEITVNNIPAAEISAANMTYNTLTPVAIMSNVPLGSSTYQGRFDTIIAWATIPKEAQAMAMQVTLDVTKVKKVTTGEILDPGVPAMAAEAVIVKWWQ